jgi:hypothetical protein
VVLLFDYVILWHLIQSPHAVAATKATAAPQLLVCRSTATCGGTPLHASVLSAYVNLIDVLWKSVEQECYHACQSEERLRNLTMAANHQRAHARRALGSLSEVLVQIKV